MPSRRKGWKVLVAAETYDHRRVWWAAWLFGPKQRNQYPRMVHVNDPPFRGKSAVELTEQEAKRAFADTKQSGRECQLIDPQGVIVKWANRTKEN